jgi:hypothetical protein
MQRSSERVSRPIPDASGGRTPILDDSSVCETAERLKTVRIGFGTIKTEPGGHMERKQMTAMRMNDVRDQP